MRCTRLCAFSVMAFSCAAITAQVAVGEPVGPGGSVPETVILRENLAPGDLIPIPDGVEIQRHYYNTRTGETYPITMPRAGDSAGSEFAPNLTGACCLPNIGLCTVVSLVDCEALGRVYQGDGTTCEPNTCPKRVYSNIGGSTGYPPGANRLIADDLTTVAVGGCAVNAYEILVTGFGDGTGPGFTTDFGIYDACPGQGGVLVPGTEGTIALPNNGVHLIQVDMTGNEVDLANHFWIGVMFDQFVAGWVMGAPAGVGFTEDAYDSYFLRCVARFGGWGLYAGFYAQVYCNDDPLTEFLAYYNSDLDGGITVPGGGQWIADDIELIVDDCELSSLELPVIGASPFTMNAELWQFCGPNFVISGTEREYEGRGDGSVEIARFVFEPGTVTLGSDSVWIAWKFSNSSTGPIVSGEPTLGYTDDLFGLAESDTSCSYWWFGGDPYAGFAATVRCLGEPPPGACCDLTGTADDELCIETPEIGCTNALARWSIEKECDDPTAFDPPCGYSACCKPNDTCVDLLPEVCATYTDEFGNPAVWQRGQFCGEGDQRCIRFQCRYAEGPCDIAHTGTGCEDPLCCDKICAQDGYCCVVEWDSQCAQRATAPPPDGCDLPPSNDECVDALSLDDFDECSAEDQLCMEQNNGGGTLNAEDPGFCCHPVGPGAQGVGSVWYKFVATTGSARIDTCSTTGAGDRADNSLIEVYKALDHSTPEDACATLVPLACNDDFPLCGPEGGNSRFDVFNLSPGQTHYIQLASKTAGDTGKYRLRVEMPSPAAAPYPPPSNNYCAAASAAADNGDTPFDLENATMDCPFEPTLPGMENDVWFSFLAATTDLLIVETCTPDSDPDTTLAVYEVGLLDPNPCPVLIENRRASNDDAGGDCGTGSRLTFNATTGSLYKIRVGGQGGGEPSGMLTLSHSPDCQPNGIPDACDISCGAPEGPCDVPGCGLAEDNNSNGIPDICEGCGDGPVAYVDPADGLWDARQPHPVDGTTPQGYSTFAVTAPERADFAEGGCWQLCETNNNPDLHLGLTANSIVSVVDNGGGSYTITLDRPIAPGEVTTITYDNTGYGGVTTTTAVFSYLPADADGDGTSAPADILAVIDSLNGVVPLPDTQVDMDRDGDPAPADILRVIDLLNGAGTFPVFLDAQIDPTGCP